MKVRELLDILENIKDHDALVVLSSQQPYDRIPEYIIVDEINYKKLNFYNGCIYHDASRDTKPVNVILIE